MLAELEAGLWYGDVCTMVVGSLWGFYWMLYVVCGMFVVCYLWYVCGMFVAYYVSGMFKGCLQDKTHLSFNLNQRSEYVQLLLHFRLKK